MPKKTEQASLYFQKSECQKNRTSPFIFPKSDCQKITEQAPLYLQKLSDKNLNAKKKNKPLYISKNLKTSKTLNKRQV